MTDFTGVSLPTPTFTPMAGARRITAWVPRARTGAFPADPSKLGGTTSGGGTAAVTKTVGQLWPRG